MHAYRSGRRSSGLHLHGWGVDIRYYNQVIIVPSEYSGCTSITSLSQENNTYTAVYTRTFVLFAKSHLGRHDVSVPPARETKTGYYAGLLTSSFMIGRLFSSHFWGVTASRFGCRLVLVLGLVSTVVFSIAFGSSTTFTWAFIFR